MTMSETAPDPDLERRIKEIIDDIPDFPEEGILFRDITPLLHDSGMFREVVDFFADRYADRGIDHIAAIESRGFIFGAALAHALGDSMSLIRKPGKLPRDVHRVEYELEYGTDVLEIHTDAVAPDSDVVIIDDLLATGGTCKAAIDLVEKCGANVVECAFLLELSDLEGRAKFPDQDVLSLAIY
jgi:adenine phosphoribosyltransferase